MRADRAAWCVLAVAGIASLPGCTASTAPPLWLPDAVQARDEAWGGWVELTTGKGVAADTVSGELLAVSEDSVYTLRDTLVLATALAAVTRGRLEYYDPRSGQLDKATLVGTISTITHGIGLIVSAPLWILVGSTSTALVSGDGKYELDPAQPRDRAVAKPGATRERHASWRDLSLYARYPSGWPVGLDRASLHERPHREIPRRVSRQRGLTSY